MSATISKTTPAIRERLRQIASPGAVLSRPQLQTTTFSWHSRTGTGGMTYVMVDKLEDGGLIKFVPAPTTREPSRVVAELTDAGRAAIVKASGSQHG